MTPPLSPLAPRLDLADRYDRLVLIAHPRHVPAAKALGDGATLVVSSDWMSWQDLMEAGQPAIHIDAVLADFNPPRDFFLGLSDWMHDAGAEVGRLNSMSVAKAMNREVELALMGFQRLWTALDALCRRFQPRQLVLIDIRGDFGQVSDPLKRLLVDQLARLHGLEVVDRLDPVAPDDPHFYDTAGYGGPVRPGGWKAALRNLLCDAIGLLFRLVRPRQPVLLFLNPMQERGLLDAWPGGEQAPFLIAQRSRKSPGFLWDSLKRGIPIASQPRLSLSTVERRAIADGIRALRAHWAARPATTPLEAARRAHLEAKVFEPGRLLDYAAEAKSIHRMLARNRVARVVVGDSSNATGRLLIEAANALHIPVDEMLNGVFVHPFASDARCGDRHGGPRLARLLSWGQSQDDWLRLIGSPLTTVRLGYSTLDRIRAVRPRLTLPALGTGNVLMLPGNMPLINVRAQKSAVYVNVIEITQALRAAGYGQIRLKVHPGHGDGAFHALNDRYGLGLEVVERGVVPDYLDWADLVVGPADSGAMVETLAAGRPYYAVVPQPNSIDPSLLGPLKLYQDASALLAALKAGEVPDRDAVLAHLCGNDPHSTASRRFWAES
jgi:hypothetical protein